MVRFDIGVQWERGLFLIKLIKIDRKIEYFKLQKNAGFINLEKFPYKFQIITRIAVDPLEWKDIKSFQGWLEQTFGGSKYSDSDYYYLWGQKSSLRWVKRGEKRYQRVRPWTSFCKFSIRNGQTELDLKENRGRKVILMFKDEKIKIERPKKIRFLER